LPSCVEGDKERQEKEVQEEQEERDPRFFSITRFKAGMKRVIE